VITIEIDAAIAYAAIGAAIAALLELGRVAGDRRARRARRRRTRRSDTDRPPPI